jgi:hypothetical protein
MRYLLLTTSLICFYFPFAHSQVQIDQAIQLTGTGSSAKITGIESSTGAEDATSVEAIQKGSLVSGTSSGSSNQFNLTLSPPISSYQTGMSFLFLANHSVNGAATININSLGAIALKKFVNVDLTGCDIMAGQLVEIAYDGTNFQLLTPPGGQAPSNSHAGDNQSCILAASTTLDANIPSVGTGTWSIISGSGGSFADLNDPKTTFSGTAGTVYVLSWTITTSCGSSSSNVTISFQPHGNQAFSYTGSNQTFTVPSNVCSVTSKLWGAGGGAGANFSISQKGGAGGYASGTIAVTPGENLTLIVGGKGLSSGFGYIGGFGGGGNAGQNDGGSGGGRSAIRRSSTELITAAGGGGGGHNGNNSIVTNGGPGGGATGVDGGSINNNEGGKGGTQSAGGAAGGGLNGVGNPGSAFQGGHGNQTVSGTGWGGGGGGGYFGGGGGGTSNGTVGGGGGGSSFIGLVTAGQTLTGSVNTPPNTSDSDYVSGIAVGANDNTNDAGHGLIVLQW